MFCFCINTPVCCMYFTSSNINLATYFSLTCSCLSSWLDSRPLKFEASIKRAAQPTSWSQCFTQLQTRHLRPNSELNTVNELSSGSAVHKRVDGLHFSCISGFKLNLQFQGGWTVFHQSNDKFGWEESFPLWAPIPSYFHRNNNWILRYGILQVYGWFNCFFINWTCR